jgi:acyl transferase domain-containing protein/acyl carrier protein
MSLRSPSLSAAPSAEAILSWLKSYLGRALGILPAQVGHGERFRNLGLDSWGAGAMLAELSVQLGRPLPPTLAWEFPTVSSLALHLAGEAADKRAPPPVISSASSEPVAVVGLACRFPGAANPSAFWQLLCGGVDAIREVPKDRWDLEALFDPQVEAPGKMSTRWGGFLEDVAGFDAAFFGVSPREAVQVDPQQRLMLELSWEALEDAGLVPGQLQGTRTGVFFGAMWMDYSRLPGAAPELTVQHTATGQDLSIIAARVSYCLGLRGPSMAINTACSSSLVALHLARQSLLRGETRLALAGGVNLILSPSSTIAMSKFGAMAPDGRCKAFDARANGYVRGEGGGVVALKRLSAALADGDRIYCLLAGTAVNNDGFSNGLTAPSPQAQEAVLAEACADARIAPALVQYVEAHGTGTALGDPIEVGALGKVFAPGREQPLRIGSVKTNIGHLEAASGIAGFIKVALAMHHRRLPPSIHFHKPSPYIPFEALRIRVQTTLEPWEAADGRRLAGVSSFGFGGTNSHVIVESGEPPQGQLLCLSAATPQALRERAAALLAALPQVTLPADVAGAQRLALAFQSAAELAEELTCFVDGQPTPRLAVGEAPPARPRVALVFGGQGSQWLGMGRALLLHEPSARALLGRCDQAMQEYVGWSLIERLQQGEAALLEQADYVQPAIFALQIALAAVLCDRGIEFEAVAGESLGEIAAAYVAGVLSLADAVRIVCVRSQLVSQSPRGRMMVVGLPLAAAQAALAGYADRLAVAVVSSPETTVISGQAEAMAELQATLLERGVSMRMVQVNYASHSPQMDPILPELRRRLAATSPRPGRVQLFSTVTGQAIKGECLDAEYWTQNLRQPVLLLPALQRLVAADFRVFVEADPHPVLAHSLKRSLAAAGVAATVIACAARNEPELQTLRDALGRLFVCGVMPQSPPPELAQLVVLSAKTADALAAQAGQLAAHLAASEAPPLAEVAYTLATGREPLRARLAIVASSTAHLRQELESVAGAAGVPAAEHAGKLGWIFTGQGAQRVGMGQELYREWEVFRRELDRVCEVMDKELGRPLKEVMWAGAGSEKLLDQTMYTQAAMFAVQWALAEQWRAFGVEPEVVMGHSVGEITAACVAGVMEVKEGARMVAARGRLMQALPAGGAMVAVEAAESVVAAALPAAGVELAAVNGARAVVIAGDEQAVMAVAAQLAASGIRSQRLRVSHAFHTARMEPMLEPFRQAAATVRYQAPRLALVSSVSGALADSELATAQYWAQQVRAPVRFADGVRAMQQLGVTRFLELGPQAALLGLVGADESGHEPLRWAALRRGRPETTAMLEALAGFYTAGGEVNWQGVFPRGGRRVELPTYPWQRRRFWLPSGPVAPRPAAADLLHPLLGGLTQLAEAALFTAQLSLHSHPWLAEHRVFDEVVFPATGFLELALAAGAQVGLPLVEELTLVAPLVLPAAEGAAVEVQLLLNGEAGAGRRTLAIHSRPAAAAAGEPWRLHAQGALGRAVSAAPPQDLDPPAARPATAVPVDLSAAYSILSAAGLGYGPAFRCMQEVWRQGARTWARVRLASTADAERYELHPALLDAALQALCFTQAPRSDRKVWLPMQWQGVELLARGATELQVRLIDSPAADPAELRVQLEAADAAGRPVLKVRQLQLRAASSEQLRPGPKLPAGNLYRVQWQAVPTRGDAATPGARAVLGLWAGGTLHERLGIPRYADLAELCQSLASETAGPLQVLVDATERPALEVNHEMGLVEASHFMTRAGLELIQRWLKQEPLSRCELVLVTQGGVAAAAADAVPGLWQAGLWGLLRSARSEHPDCPLRTLDLEAESARERVQAALGVRDEPELAVRGAEVLAPRLGVAQPGGEALTLASGTVLLSGGTGELGRQVAVHLVRAHAVRKLLLLSRRGEQAAGAEKLRAELQQLGAQVTIAACDVSCRQQLAAQLQALPAAAPLCAVFHCAGVLDDGPVESLSSQQLERVLYAKVDGAAHLDELTAALPLQAFVLFSSVAGLLGTAGQANYAAANAWLDALAARRRAHGRAGQSLAWGLWEPAGEGMASRLRGPDLERLQRQGIVPLSAAAALRLLTAALGTADATLVPLQLEATTAPAAALLRELLRGRSAPPAIAAEGAAVSGHLAGLAEPAREAWLVELVKTEAAAVLGLAGSAAIGADKALKELGLDSLMAVELRNRLAARTGTALPSTIVFDHPSPQKLAALLLTRLAAAPRPTAQRPTQQARQQATPAAASPEEPIAIVAMACRLPGGIRDPEGYWQVLREGRDVVAPFPRERWDREAIYDPDPDAPGKSYCQHGGFVADIDQFEPEFFGISLREAQWMDPQQRLLLETAWEALERAGLAPGSLEGSSTGVFIGQMGSDYGNLTLAQPAALGGYASTGVAASVTSGRLAYLLGLQGPALTVDTACSSSLVAVHLACQALRRGECTLAIAGGVTVMTTPTTFIEFCRLRAVAPDGRCKSFAAQADGVGWSEGCGVLLLKRLTDAQRDGDQVLALIRSSAVNQDGKSQGLTAPSGPSQERVIRRALQDAGLQPADLDAVEAHGTGTRLGDPIEAGALAAVFAPGRQRPLYLGSAKANLGHTQAAAGVAGVMKLVLSLQQEQLPRTLHAEEPSPHIAWQGSGLALLQQAQPWPRSERVRRAGVSSFGISGTNAHVILEEAPPAPLAKVAPEEGWLPLALSGKSAAALRAQAAQLAAHLAQHEEQPLGDIAYTLAVGREPLPHRLVVVTRSRARLREELEAVARGEERGAVVAATADHSGMLGWIFTGQGAQRVGMGQELYREWEVFRRELDRVCEVMDKELGRPLKEVMWAGAGSEKLLDQTMYTQAAMFAVQWALAEQWRAFGVEPEVVMGHSVGEITAACVAGVMEVKEGARMVAARGRLMQALPAGGAMVSLEAAEQEVAAAVLPCQHSVSVAAVNGPRAVVISGAEAEVTAIAGHFVARGVRATRLTVSHAFHSPHMEPMLEEFRRLAETLSYRAPRIPLVSTVTGAAAGAAVASASYWVRQVRATVRFCDGVRTLEALGVNTFLELGPRGTLLALVPACVVGPQPVLLASLGGGRSESQAMLEALSGYQVRGGAVDWQQVFPGHRRKLVLPTYPWQRQRCWIDHRPAPPVATATGEPATDELLRRLEQQPALSGAARAALPELRAALAQQRAAAAAKERAAGLFYALRWRPLPLAASSPVPAEPWAVLAAPPLAELLAAGLQRAGVQTVVLADLAALRAALAEGSRLTGLVCATGLQPEGEQAVLAVLRLLAATRQGAPRCWLLTRGAVGKSPEEPPAAVEQAVLWGLGRTFALEHPRAWGGLLDLPPEPLLPAQAEQVGTLVTSLHGEDQLALRDGQVLAARLTGPLPPPPPRDFTPQGTVLVTGGLGGLGLHVARWLVDKGARHLVLVGRRGLSAPGAAAAVAELRERGAAVQVAAVDVTAADPLREVLATLPATAPLRAVFHVAGVVDSTPLAALTPERLAEVLAAKREGTRVLDELTRHCALQAFVCFSSIAGVWGAGGQAAYAASNAFLDAWAQKARAAGRPALAIAWGPWLGDGMVSEAVGEQLSRRGLRGMPPALALAALEQALTGQTAHAVVADVDWPTFRRGFEAWGPRSLLRELGEAPVDAAPVADAVLPLRDTLAALAPSAREAHLRGWLQAQCSAVLGHPASRSLDLQRGFFDLGLDSLMAVELRRRIQRALGIEVSTVAMFDHPSITALGAHLLTRLGLDAEPPPDAAASPPPPAAPISQQDLLALIETEFEALK